MKNALCDGDLGLANRLYTEHFYLKTLFLSDSDKQNIVNSAISNGRENVLEFLEENFYVDTQKISLSPYDIVVKPKSYELLKYLYKKKWIWISYENAVKNVLEEVSPEFLSFIYIDFLITEAGILPEDILGVYNGQKNRITEYIEEKYSDEPAKKKIKRE